MYKLYALELVSLLILSFNLSFATNAVDDVSEYAVYLSNDLDLSQYSLGSNFLNENSVKISKIPTSSYSRRKMLRSGASYPTCVLRFEDTLNKTGWGVLDLETNKFFHDGIQAYTAGFAEGYATGHQIYPMAINVADTLFRKLYKKPDEHKVEGIIEMPKDLKKFFEEQEAWTYQMVQRYLNQEVEDRDTDFFFQVGLIMEQFEGLVAGYEYRRQRSDGQLPKLERWVFQMLNGAGDLNDLIPALMKDDDIQKQYDYFNMDFEQAETLIKERSHCSAIVKVLPGNEDLLVGHNSWFAFAFTNRIFKHYTFNFNHRATAAKGISFSSYPGFLESLDDFYMLDSGLTWTQTSNEVLDKSIYDKYISPESLLAWQRVRVASAMSYSGPDFFIFMQRFFSGTYANQYIVVDLNLFTPGEPLQDHTLWIVEEMPGYIIGEDKTEILRYGYFPSYNVPLFHEIWKDSGYGKMTEKFKENATRYSHSLAPRAEIFRRDQNSVRGITDLKKLLRYNDYKNDKYSENDPYTSICSRGDLRRKEKKPYGCFDAKVTSFKFGAMNRTADIVSGPTSKFTGSAEYIESYDWSKDFSEVSHVGLPKKYEFPFMKTQPFYQRFKPDGKLMNSREFYQIEN